MIAQAIDLSGSGPIDAKLIFCAGVMPALLTAIAIIAGGAWRDGRERLAAMTAIAVGLAFVIGLPCLVDDLAVSPPKRAWQWIFWFGVGAMVVGAVELAIPRRRSIVLLVATLVALVGYYLVARGVMLRPRGWTGGEAVLWIALSTIATMAMTLASTHVTKVTRTPRAAACAVAVIAMVNSALIGFEGGAESLARTSGIVVSAAGVIALFSILMPHLNISPSVWFALALLITGTATASLENWHAEVPLYHGLLVLFAGVAMLAARLADLRRSYAPTAVAVLACLAMLAIPIGRVIETAIRYRGSGFM